MKKILITMIVSLSITVLASIVSNQVDYGSEIFADDLNQMFAQVETALSNNSELTNITFTDYTIGEEISRSGANGILTKLYTITELYPNSNELDLLLGYEDVSGNPVVDFLNGNYINSGELNALFNKVINDIQSYTPISSSGSTSSYAIGKNHGCVMEGTDIYCWGENANGALGAGNISNQNKKVQTLIPSSETPVSLHTGSQSTGTCAQMESGKIYCWGDNDYGETGKGSFSSDERNPLDVTASFSSVLTQGESILKIEQHTNVRCFLTSLGKFYCLGYNVNTSMVLTNGFTRINRPGEAESTFKDFAMGAQHICLIDTSDKTYCFGSNGGNQLGDPSLPTSFYKVAYTQNWIEPVAPNGIVFSKIYAGLQGTCALDTNNDVYCWGYRLGGAGTARPTSPEKVSIPQGINVQRLTVGANHACILGDDTKIYCWGEDRYDQLGRGDLSPTVTYDHYPQPLYQQGLERNIWSNYDPTPHWVDVYAGRYHTCALDSVNQIRCWGDNAIGQLGDDTGFTTRNVASYPVVQSYTNPVP